MGQYLEIPLIVYPTTGMAAEGETVAFTVIVENVSTMTLKAAVTARVDGVELQGDQRWIDKNGGQASFLMWFTMPNHSVTVEVWAFFLATSGEWIEDASDSFVITLEGEEPPPEVSASIESLKVYSEGTAPISPPLLDVTPGKKLSVKFDAHSAYGSLPFGLWFDADVILEKPVTGSQARHDTSQTGPYSKCTLDHFDFKNDWVADEKGTYYATIILRARTSLVGSSVEVARRSNVKVFTVTQDPTPPGADYDGEIRYPKIRKCNSTWQSLENGAAEIPAGNTIEVKFDGRNLCGCYAAMHGWVTVKDPSGATIFSDYDDYTTIRADNTDHHFKFPSIGCSAQKLSQTGKHTVEIVLKAEHDGVEKEVDRETHEFTVTEAEVPDGEPGVYEGKITDIVVNWNQPIATWHPIEGLDNVPVGEHIQIRFEGWNIDGPLMKLRAELWLYAPDGSLLYNDDDISTLPYSAGSSHEFCFPKPPQAMGPISMEGRWKLKIQLTNSTGEYLLAKYADEEGNPKDAFGAEVPPPSIWGILEAILPLMLIMMMMGMLIPMTKELGEGTQE